MCVCCIVFVQGVEFHCIWKWPSSRVLVLSFIRGSAVLLRKWHWFYWVQMHWCTSAVLSFYRVFCSSAYESDHLAVFHSRYITDRVRAGDRSKVILGHYFLPPQDIVARKYQRCREIIYSLLTRMLPGSQDSLLVERQTPDQKVASLSPGRSGGRIFYSRVNFPWWLTQCPLHPVRKRPWSFPSKLDILIPSMLPFSLVLSCQNFLFSIIEKLFVFLLKARSI